MLPRLSIRQGGSDDTSGLHWVPTLTKTRPIVPPALRSAVMYDAGVLLPLQINRSVWTLVSRYIGRMPVIRRRMSLLFPRTCTLRECTHSVVAFTGFGILSSTS
jgi:hypothetical protein